MSENALRRPFIFESNGLCENIAVMKNQYWSGTTLLLTLSSIDKPCLQ